MTVDRFRPILEGIPLLSGLAERDVERIVRGARTQRVEPGHVVIERGDPPDAVFAVATGRLKVVAPRSDGRDATLHILGPGDVFGEVAILHAQGRTARVTALEESVLLIVDRRAFTDLLASSSDFAQRLLALLASRLRDTIEHFDATTSLELPERLARKLLLLGDHFGRASPAGVELGIRLSQRELGDLVDATRQSVNRLLRQWTAEGLVAQREGRLWLLDPEGLRAVARLSPSRPA